MLKIETNETLACETDFFKRLVNTWMRVYQITQPTKRQQEIRLKELQTWDSSNGHIEEHRAKKHALIRLIGGQKPTV
jgi:hypothetical protein